MRGAGWLVAWSVGVAAAGLLPNAEHKQLSDSYGRWTGS